VNGCCWNPCKLVFTKPVHGFPELHSFQCESSLIGGSCSLKYCTVWVEKIPWRGPDIFHFFTNCCEFLIDFYPRDAMLAQVIAIATCPSVCLSVRPSRAQYCVKNKKSGGMISSPSGSPKTLVFWRQISSPNSKGFPPNGGLKQGSVGKIQRFFSSKRQYLENGSRYG